ncbi:MAG: GNAT family N-acetyltransferase [Candidatus Helarchaeales archaeon]
MTIRNVCIQDKQRITALAQECSPMLRPSVEGTYEFLARCFSNTFFVHEDGQELLGFIVGFPNTAVRGEFWLYQVCVKPDARGRKIGSELFEKFVLTVKDEGYERIFSHVKFGNEISLKLHQKFGFKIHEEDDRGMILELKF